MPYEQCVKMTEELCQSGGSPVTKLKLIVKIAKEIMREIQRHYSSRKVEPPEMDPDSLMTIIMYIVFSVATLRFSRKSN